MNKPLLALLMGSMLFSTTCIHTQGTLSSYPRAAARHIFSTHGIADVTAAYGLVMFMTLIHELGHAAVAKLVCGAPVDIVIGGKRRPGSRLKCAGVEFAGFNPLESDSRWEEHHKADLEIYHPSLAQDTAVLLAGPVAQAITCCCMFAWLKNKDNFHITKLTALGGVADTILGINGMYGARYLEWTDSAKIVKNIKQLFSTSKLPRTS